MSTEDSTPEMATAVPEVQGATPVAEAPESETSAAAKGSELTNLLNAERKDSNNTIQEALQNHDQPIRVTTPPLQTTKELSQSDDPMSASAITIKPSNHPHAQDNGTQYLTPQPSSYVDPTPPTPMTSNPPSRSPSATARSTNSDDASPSRHTSDRESKQPLSDDEHEPTSQSEIQNIMAQFNEFGGGPGADEVMSPRLEIASPMLNGPVQHPPRKSSLTPPGPSITGKINPDVNALRISTDIPTSQEAAESLAGPPVPPKDGTLGTPPRRKDQRDGSLKSPTSSHSLQRPPPPEPEPEPALPFDFHRFLEQLRNKKADPVARYLKSFLNEFGKRQWMVHEQVKIIGDFLAFIANKMMHCDVWIDVSDAEFDNAREGMEKLVMNRLYSQTFSPAIPAPKPVPGAKPRKRGGDPPFGPGRRGQHQEDVERDDIVSQKINIYGWIKEEHLDIPPVGDSGRRFLKLAQQELLKIKSYRAPRDKIICVLNCCKVIFGLLKHNKSDSSADSFMPLLIYVVLQCNPEHLVSNVQYILRFRNQDKLGGEAGYYLSSLMGAVQFIENMDRTSLTITDEDFEKNVEAAVSAIAEKHQALSPIIRQASSSFSEKPQHHSQPTTTGSGEGTSSSPNATKEHESDITAPITGLLRTIQRPLTTIGRIFAEDVSSPAPGLAPSAPIYNQAQAAQDVNPEPVRDSARRVSNASKHSLSAEEAAARQASAETAEAQRLQRAEHSNVVETLAGMFPDLDKDIISDVVYEKEGRVGLAVDACLALST